MAIIKTYPLKTSYFSQDRLVLSDMQPDSEGIVKGETKSLTLASLKNFIGSQVLDVSASTDTRYAGAFVSPSTGNVKVGIDISSLPNLTASSVDGTDKLIINSSQDNKKIRINEFFETVGLATNSLINYSVKLPNSVGGPNQVLQLPSTIGASPYQLEWTTPAGSGTVVGSGTANYIPKWNSSSGLTDSIIYESSSNIGINTSSPSAELDVQGANVPVIKLTETLTGGKNILLGVDTNNGFLRSSGNMLLQAGSLYQGINILESGNVGIGATAPGEKLEVAGKIKATGTADVLQLYRNSLSQANYIKFYDNATLSPEFYLGFTSNNRDFQISNLAGSGTISLRSGGGNTMTLDSSQKVGIGTSTPTDKLTVAGNIKTTSGFIGIVSSGYGNMELGGPSGAYIDLKGPSTDDYDLRIISGGSGGSFWTGGFGHIMTLSSTGNVGISVTNPAAKLDITDTVDQTAIRVTNNEYNNYLIQKRRTDDTQKLGIKEFGSNGGLALVTGSSERLNINNLGNIGIGTTAPNAKLHIQDTSGSISTIRMSAASSNANYAFMKMEDVTANTSKLTLGATIGYAVEKPALSIFDSYTTLLGNGTSNGRLLFNCSANTHSVEIQGPDHAGGTSYSLKLPNSLPSVSNQILESNALGVLSWIPTPSGGGGGGGTVTSVGLSAPPAFSVSNSPITGSGSISLGVTGGTVGEFLAYNGQWATPPDTGTIVVGNPSTGASAVLAGISIGSTVYSIPQGTGNGTITSVQAGTGISGGGSSGIVTVTNSDRGSTAVAALDFFKTIATPTNDVIASGNDDTLTLAAGGNTGIFINGSGSQVTIGLYQPTTTALGGVKLVDVTQQSVSANGLTYTAGRTYAIQLNSSGQAVVNVPWSGGSGGGISFSGATVGGLATFTNSSTAGVSSKVNLDASGLMDFDFDGNHAGSIDFDPTGTRLKIGDLSSGNSGIVEIFTDGTRQFQIGVNGEIGLGEFGSQGTSGQFLQSQGNGSPAIWTSSGAGGGSSGTSGMVQLADGSSGFTNSASLVWEIISGLKGKLVIGKNTGTIYDREGILRLEGGPNSAGTGGVGGTIELEAAVGKSINPPAITKIKAPVSNSTAQSITLPAALPTATSQVLGVTSITGSEVVTAWTNTSGSGITQTIMPWNATLARADGTSWTETNAAGAIRSDTMVIQVNDCFATIQGNVVNYQFYISGYFKGNSEADGQYASITGPLFLARCQNIDGSGTISGIPIEASQSTTVIDNNRANGSLVVTEDPFATKQSASVPATVGNMGTYWKLPIRGGKVGRAYTSTTTIPGFVQLFTSNAVESTNPGKDHSTCVYPTNSTDVWYSNQYEYMPEGKGYTFVFAGTITAFVNQSS
jgi:hypothetical protein